MYTIEDIRDIAIQIERNGEKTYRSAAEQSTDEKMKTLFNWMADEEHKHAKWFENMVTMKPPIIPEHREMEAMGRSLLQEMVKNQTFSLDSEALGSAKNTEALLRLSLGFEEDTILFYEMLKNFIDEEQTAAQLEMIIDEERGHVKLLKSLSGRLSSGSEIDFTCMGGQ